MRSVVTACNDSRGSFSRRLSECTAAGAVLPNVGADGPDRGDTVVRYWIANLLTEREHEQYETSEERDQEERVKSEPSANAMLGQTR